MGTAYNFSKILLEECVEMKKSYVKLVFFALLLVPVLFFFSCEEGALMLDVPDEMSDYDFDSGEEPVTLSDLDDFVGDVVTQANMDSMFTPESSTSSSLRTVLTTVMSALDPGSEERAINAYFTELVTIEDESITVEGMTVDFTKGAAGFSVAGGWDGDLTDFVDMPNMPEDLFSAIGSVDGSLLINLDFDVKASTDETFTGGNFKSAAWHHTSYLSIDNKNVTLEYDDVTGDISVSGTTDIQCAFKTSLGFTLSGDADAKNGKFIVVLEMEDIDEEDISLANLSEDMQEAIESGNEEEVYDVVSQYFFEGAESFLSITITAYKNNGDQAASVEIDPFEFMFM